MNYPQPLPPTLQLPSEMMQIQLVKAFWLETWKKFTTVLEPAKWRTSPLSSENFRTPGTLEKAYRECVNSWMAFFARGIRINLTKSKTFTNVKNKNQQTLIVTGPGQLQEHLAKATLSGIEIVGKPIGTLLTTKKILSFRNELLSR